MVCLNLVCMYNTRFYVAMAYVLSIVICISDSFQKIKSALPFLVYGSSMACTGPSKFCHSTFAPGALHDKVPSVLKTNYINVFEMLFSYKCFIFFFVVHGNFTSNVDMSARLHRASRGVRM